VFPEQFTYHRANSVAEAISLLGSVEDAKIIAGGHSLLPAMKLRLAAPAALIDISRVAELKGISVGNGVAIGGGVTYRELEMSAELAKALPIIKEVAYVVGDPQVRSRGTLGGSLAHSDPAADFPAVMLALNASVTAVGPNGSRTIAVDDLFVDLLQTSLDPNEVLTAITIPQWSANAGMAYEKHAHPASGYAVVGVAAMVVKDGANAGEVRIAVTGATTKATRAKTAEAALSGKPLTAENIAAAAAQAADGLEINGDHYASEEYRAHLIGVLARRALTRAAGL
jgi:aerobic carbon-monoxide dehydrogenase medium subunit